MDDAEKENQLAHPSLADLVVLARGLNPFPYRTRPLNSSAPMVLSLKAWKSRSLPGLLKTVFSSSRLSIQHAAAGKPAAAFLLRGFALRSRRTLGGRAMRPRADRNRTGGSPWPPI